MLYCYDKKVIKALKAAQYTDAAYVYIDPLSMECYHLADISHKDIESVMGYPSVSKIKIPPAFLYSSLKNLEQDGYIRKPLSKDIYQVTYNGWFAASVRRSEILKLIMTHVVFPSAVALVTTILTLLINSWLGNK